MQGKNHYIGLAFFASDTAASIGAALAALFLRNLLPFGGEAALPPGQYRDFFLVLIPFLLLVHLFSGQYQRLRDESVFGELVATVRQSFFALTAMLALTFFYREYLFSRLLVAYFFACLVLFTFSGRLVLRLVLRALRRRGFNQQHVLAIGTRARLAAFQGELASLPGFGYRIAAALALDGRGRTAFSEARLAGLLAKNAPGAVFLLASGESGEAACFGGIVERCDREGIPVRIVPDVASYLAGSGRLSMLGRLLLVEANATPLDLWYNRLAKRAFDVVLGGLFLLVSLPIQLLIALLVKTTSPGPVFFSQERLGHNRRPFRMLKFRTMRVQPARQSDTRWTTAHDDRLTRIGRLLRRSSLDELPQLFQVVSGRMSLVGPRPERPFFVEQFRDAIPEYMARHRVKSGMTGWAQIHGLRGDTSIELRVQADLHYIRNWSLLLDLRIVVLTFIKGLVGKNAY